jgi:hypothetical protein
MSSNIKFDGQFQNYPHFKVNVDQNLRNKGKKYILSAQRPHRPSHGASDRRRESYRKDSMQFNADSEIALSIVTGLLGREPLARVQHILLDDDLSDHRKVKLMLQLLEDAYVPQTDVTARLYKNAIDDIPSISPLISDREAAILVESIITVMIEQSSMLNLHNFQSRLRDPELIAKLFSKIMNHSLLKQYRSIYTRESSRRTFTFAEVCQELRDELISVREGFRNIPSQPLAVINPTSLDVSSSLQSSVSAARNLQAEKVERPCWNCQNAHKASDCPATFCRNCRKFFSSTRDPLYHPFTQCPQRPPPRSTSSGKRQSETFDKPFTKKANAATNYIDNSSDSDSEEYYDDNTYFCAMMRHRDSRRSIPENRLPTSPELAMIDSGTNLHVANYTHAKFHSVDILQYHTPKEILFGNNTITYSTHYANFGPLIGKVSLINEAPDFLLSVSKLMRLKLLIIVFQDTTVTISTIQKQVLAVGDYYAHRQDHALYYINVEPLINYSKTFLSKDPNIIKFLPSSDNQPDNDIDIACTRKEISVSSNDFLSVMELHKRLNHASKSSMINGLKNHTWSGIDLSHQLVDRVMSRYSCLGCLLGKANRLPRALGSQIPSTHVAQVISVDRVGPIKPAALGDFTYIYLFVDDYSDFWCSILAKPPANSAQFIAAIQTVRLYYLKYGHRILKFRFDAGTIENSDLVNQYLALHSIISDPAAPGAQYQDPAERHIQTLIKFVTTCLIDQKYLDNLFWGLATLSVTHTHNALPSLNFLTIISSIKHQSS